VNKTKPEIINVCVSSLIDSINRVKDHQIELFVLDDASPDDCLTDIMNILAQCKFPVNFIPVDNGSGNAYTMKKVYEIVENHCTDLWYHVEDDYLHFPSAIQDLIDSVDQFEANTEQMVAINPHDDIWRYNMNLYKSFILLGPYRHYRTVEHTTYTCLASKDIYNKYKKHFQDVVTLTEQGADWVEDKSINLVWRKDDVMLFSPIPSLALHIMDPSGKDPYIDFDALWNSVPELWRLNE
jgi:glycosyltransferase involved in cell wall biosynthesis